MRKQVNNGMVIGGIITVLIVLYYLLPVVLIKRISFDVLDVPVGSNTIFQSERYAYVTLHGEAIEEINKLEGDVKVGKYINQRPILVEQGYAKNQKELGYVNDEKGIYELIIHFTYDILGIKSDSVSPYRGTYEVY